jgi:hypothetical protein
MTLKGPMTTSRAAAKFDQIQIEDVLQAGSATAIVDPATEDRGTDADGWIDCRSASLIHVTASAVGAGITVTAQIKTSEDAPAISLALTDGALDADTSEIILDDVIKAGFIRFLAAGTVGGANTLSLYILLK